MTELPTPQRTSWTIARLGRWGLLGAVVLMGGALLATVWSTNRGVRDASETLLRGQSSVFFGAIFSSSRSSRTRRSEPLTTAELAEIVDQHAADGLRYVAQFDRSGELLASAGQPASDARALREAALRQQSDDIQWVDGRVRMVLGRRTRTRTSDRSSRGDRSDARGGLTVRGADSGDDGADGGGPSEAGAAGERARAGGQDDPAGEDDPAGAGEDDSAEQDDSADPTGAAGGTERGGGRRQRTTGRERTRPIVLIEFEPRIALELRAAAVQSLSVGVIAAGALLLMAVALVRWYMRREALERQLAHERRLASLGEMSAVLAHEIRNPIASLKGNAQLLVKMLPDEGKPRSKAGRLVDEAIRLETLTNDLLEFVRAGELARGDVDPAALMREAAAPHDDRVVIDAAGAPAAWSLDPGRMRQVLSNLIENACQACDGPVEVSVEVSVEAGRASGSRRRPRRDGARDGVRARRPRGKPVLVFTVRDHGDGIATQDADHIFEPFYTRKTRGTGLGLAVARRIVERHGGAVSASNAADGGAVFRVEIPG